MVSTRSQSVLSAGALLDTAGTRGEVDSTVAPPRRSGRTQSGGGTPAAAVPRSVRTTRTRRQLADIQEEEEAAAQHQHQQDQPEQQQQAGDQQLEGQGEHEQPPREAKRPLSPRMRRRSAPAAAPAAASSPAAANDATSGQSLKADAAVVDILAQQMFAALESVHVPQADGSVSGSEEAEEGEQQGLQQQQQQQGAAAGRDTSYSGSSSESEREGNGRQGAGHLVPRHLCWQPELTLPGQAGHSTTTPAAAAAPGGSAAAAVGVHVVRRGNDGLHLPAPDERVVARAVRRDAPDTAGKGWFDLPATQITDEVKNDLRMLRLRGALDPKAHYKKLDSTKFPKYFQLGTVVEGAADFYSGRLTNKQRKRTLTEEIMADAHLTEVRKKRYTKMQEERSQWSRKKGPGKKSNNERRKQPHHRPKH